MAEAPRNDLDPLLLRGLVTDLTGPDSSSRRLDHVAQARRHAEARAYDDGAVVQEIASQLLLLSRP